MYSVETKEINLIKERKMIESIYDRLMDDTRIKYDTRHQKMSVKRNELELRNQEEYKKVYNNSIFYSYDTTFVKKNKNEEKVTEKVTVNDDTCIIL